MNTIQQNAHSSPCFEPEETINPRFKHLEQHWGWMVSVMLTANIGLE